MTLPQWCLQLLMQPPDKCSRYNTSQLLPHPASSSHRRIAASTCCALAPESPWTQQRRAHLGAVGQQRHTGVLHARQRGQRALHRRRARGAVHALDGYLHAPEHHAETQSNLTDSTGSDRATAHQACAGLVAWRPARSSRFAFLCQSGQDTRSARRAAQAKRLGSAPLPWSRWSVCHLGRSSTQAPAARPRLRPAAAAATSSWRSLRSALRRLRGTCPVGAHAPRAHVTSKPASRQAASFIHARREHARAGTEYGG